MNDGAKYCGGSDISYESTYAQQSILWTVLHFPRDLHWMEHNLYQMGQRTSFLLFHDLLMCYLQCSTEIQCASLQFYDTMLCCTLLHFFSCAAICCTLLCCNMLYSAVLQYAVLCCAALYCTILCFAILSVTNKKIRYNII